MDYQSLLYEAENQHKTALKQNHSGVAGYSEQHPIISSLVGLALMGPAGAALPSQIIRNAKKRDGDANSLYADQLYRINAARAQEQSAYKTGLEARDLEGDYKYRKVIGDGRQLSQFGLQNRNQGYNDAPGSGLTVFNNLNKLPALDQPVPVTNQPMQPMQSAPFLPTGRGLPKGMQGTFQGNALPRILASVKKSGAKGGPEQGLSLTDKITAVANRLGIDPRLAIAMANQESGGNPRARSNKGAMGVFQLMPDTARNLGVTDPYNVDQNIEGGLKYLKQQLDAYNGDTRAALAAYNGGPGAVSYLRKTGYAYNPNVPIDRWSNQTAGYVKNIMSKVGAQPSSMLSHPAGVIAQPTEFSMQPAIPNTQEAMFVPITLKAPAGDVLGMELPEDAVPSVQTLRSLMQLIASTGNSGMGQGVEMAKWSGEAPVRNANITQSLASARSSNANAANNEAEQPYIAPLKQSQVVLNNAQADEAATTAGFMRSNGGLTPSQVQQNNQFQQGQKGVEQRFQQTETRQATQHAENKKQTEKSLIQKQQQAQREIATQQLKAMGVLTGKKVVMPSDPVQASQARNLMRQAGLMGGGQTSKPSYTASNGAKFQW
jgi:soluble lytic murein transglycosylase-like protein